MLFLLSLVLTRGVDSVRSDMDDVTHLTAQFGYCTQVHTNYTLHRVLGVAAAVYCSCLCVRW
jgi:Domain of unknown function (DUF4205)